MVLRGGGYWVICGSGLAHYVWEVVVDRASVLGGGAVGIDALAAGERRCGTLLPQGDPEAARAS